MKKLRIKHGTRLSSTAIKCSCLFCILFLPVYILSTLLRSRTIAGDNLLPTPWHPFHTKFQLSRAPKILGCSSLSCRLNRHPPRTTTVSNVTCPEFFSWIHRDLSPWAETGITTAMLDRAREFAAFRVVIVGRELYTDLYYRCVQSRVMFTVWGLLMLLEKYPGMVPDVDFMFNCMDKPQFSEENFKQEIPPPLFGYCTTKNSFDIPFPDWSYWGWPEVNIGPWAEEAASIFRGSESESWIEKKPRAQWKGNPAVAEVRNELVACNCSDYTDIHIQNWMTEAQDGYKNSKLENQCGHRFKVYAEGFAWSVSFKYILACGSTLLQINPEYYDFFMRGLVPQEHFLPIDRDSLCPSIEQAVVWGNNHTLEAERIGKHAQDFLRQDLSMDRVYDYMLHLLQKYAKLQRFVPRVPAGAQSVCKESVLCIAEPLHREYLERSAVDSDTEAASPCVLG